MLTYSSRLLTRYANHGPEKWRETLTNPARCVAVAALLIGGSGCDGEPTPAQDSGLAETVAAQSVTIANLQTQIRALETRVAVDVTALQAKTASMSTTSIDGYDAVVFEGVNLHVRSGSGSTQSVNGLGNFVVGYQESRATEPNTRIGSHMIIVGNENNYSSYGGVIVGKTQSISTLYSVIAGGRSNSISGNNAFIGAGLANTVTSNEGALTGGNGNTSSRLNAFIGGGANQTN